MRPDPGHRQPDPPALDLISAIGSQDSYLAVVSALRSDGTPHSSVVNAAVVAHPVTGAQVGAFVTYGPVKLAHLRRRPALTLTWRSGWSWVSLEGTAQLAGPHDRLPGLDPAHLPGLLRAIFTAAGGEHPDWDTYDRIMAEQSRVAVLINPTRVYTNAS